MNKQISTTIGILIVVFTAGLAGASVVLFNQEAGKEVILEEGSFSEKDKIALEDNLELELDKNTEEGASEIDDFANWNTYRNKEYGFEIKYPDTWKERDELINNNQISFINFGGNGEYVQVSIWGNSQNLEPLMFHKESCAISSDGPASREYFCEQGYKEGKNVSKGQNNFLQYVLPDAVPYVSSQISGNGFLYQIIREFTDYPMYEGPLYPEYETIYNKMLFTFKLL